MKHVIDLPNEIEQALERRACETGDDIARLIETAVVAFVRDGAQPSSRRMPDAPLEPIETLPPCDLPRNRSQLIKIEKMSQRMPDLTADPA